MGTDFATHVLGMLEAQTPSGEQTFHLALQEEIERLGNLVKNFEDEFDTGYDELVAKPSELWTAEEVGYMGNCNRADVLQDLLDNVTKESALFEDLSETDKRAVGDRLVPMLIRALETEDDLPPCCELSDIMRARIKSPYTLGPAKMPPWIQALQLLEFRLIEVHSSLDSRQNAVHEILEVQIETMWYLKCYLICELFPIQENVYHTAEQKTFLLDEQWRVWIITTQTAANDS